nr:unnamed protein product [Callosobruchus chinensis]
MEKCSVQVNLKSLDKIQFHVSGVEHTVHTNDVTPEMTLNSYLREKSNLTGTKRMCLEGGCGTCIVAVEENINGKKKVFAVNSCLVSILSCHGWKIHTVEGIGGPLQGFHPVQTSLANGNGTQCGFCSPGMVMNMYALMEGSGGQLTESTVENSFGGVLCRCTGYRPIVQSFRSLIRKEKDDLKDIEDLKLCKIDGKCKTNCEQKCKQENYYHTFQQSKWMKVHNLNDLLDILISAEDATYQLVGGNTARGVYYITNPPQLYIDITSVKELISTYVDSTSLILGANTTLTQTVEIFNNAANEYPGFRYLRTMAEHIVLVAHVPVRNIGTMAGNLMIKHMHNDFPSDIFLILETFKATLSIVDTSDEEILCSPQDFLRINMFKKIMPRAQNAHADVNAGFLFKLSPNQVVESPRIVFGGISATFVHASKTEELLKGKRLFDNKVLAQAFESLNKEIEPTWELPDATPTYRKHLAIALFYKCPKELLSSSRLSSGGTLLQRPLSVAIQEFGTITQNYPLSEPIPKVEALAQTSATAVANSQLGQIDPSEALKVPGVIAFYTAKDIPGNNTFMPRMMGSFPVQEELFCSGRVQYYYQPIGLIVADSHDTALQAAEMVKVEYTAPTATPFLNVRQVVEANARNRIRNNTNVVPRRKGTDIQKVIKGEFYVGWQYHFHMEVQCCQVVPTEDGLDIFPSSQWLDLCQLAAAEALAIPTQTINVRVRRLGGAFGAKISRFSVLSTAASLAAFKLRRPVKIWMPYITNMNVIGKRYPLLCRYEVAVNAQGVIQYLKADLYSDFGVGGNEPMDTLLVDSFQNTYLTDTWSFSTYQVNTDTHANTWARAPGTLEGMGAIESIFDHIAYEINVDPTQVRLANTDRTRHAKIMDYWKDLETWANIPARKQAIEQFNQQNRWRKRGMSIVPMAWILEFSGNFSVLVSIVHGDGGIMVSHGGIEMGQGINTKVAQVTAFKFGVRLDKVQVKPSLNLVAVNSSTTGGSLTSEAVVYGIITACDTLIARMKPVRDRMTNPTFQQNSPGVQTYPIYGICATEVEVDILTGQKIIHQVDIIEDVGDSMSPLVDIGQTEGAFVMGIGYYTIEQCIFDPQGRLRSNRTWNYRVPGMMDIPVNYRIKFPQNNPNPVGILKSKAVGEPPCCLSISVPLAIRRAMASAREESDSTQPKWVPFDETTSTDFTFRQSLNHHKHYRSNIDELINHLFGFPIIIFRNMEMFSVEKKFKILDKIQLHISGVEYTVSTADVSPETTLNSYLREKSNLTGTKRMCLEGGCGTCIVAVEENVNGKRNVFAVNSCLVSILSCHGWKIHTVEGIGGPLQGFHPVQTTLAQGNGTQCGFCSPGMVMNMFALIEGHGKLLSESTVENSFGGVLCRCTGYRPIVHSFRSLVKKQQGKINDIEDIKPCKTDGKCRTDCRAKCKQENYYHAFQQSKWMKVHNINDLLDILISAEDAKYQLVMPRAQNAHADVNSGFLVKLTSNRVVESATIVYGGISARCIHASKTEELLKGKPLFDNKTLTQVFQSLDAEIQPTWEPPEATPTYRKNLAIALFYKFILNKCPRELLTNSRLSSGGTVLQRPLSVAIQEFGTNPKNYPLSEPVPKVEAVAQTSGQAEYCADLPNLPNQTFGAFVTAAAVANSHIDQIDPAEALDMPGVVALFTAKDIPGINTFAPKMMGSLPVREELFCSGRVQYYYQPVGLIVADSQETALKAAEMVKIKYTAPTEAPFLNVKQVVEADAKNRMKHNTNFVPRKKGNDIKKVIKGDFYMGWQYHFHMEVQCCQVVPTEDGLDMFPASQWMDLAQLAAAEALAIPTQTINVKIRRLGGGFGAKISRSALLSTAAALAAYKLRRPVKIWLPFITNMNVIGKRYPLLCRYEVAISAQGVIQYLKADLYSDFGVGGNDTMDTLLVDSFQNTYDSDTWSFSTYQVTTDTHANTWARAPGTLEGMGAIESIFEQISYEMNLDPIQVRLANTDKIKHAKILDYWKDIQTWADIPARQQTIKNFNKQNRWKKRGMSLIPMAWILEFSANFSVLVSIVHGDGGIMVSHGGIEMGQGINTKVAQVTAFKFGVSLDKVQVKPSSNLVSVNSSTTGGSFTSEAVVYGVITACDTLIGRMKPVREKMTNPTWEQLVAKCYSKNIQLTANGFFQSNSPGVQTYPIYGICATEVEVDILTGQKIIHRVDIIEDVGIGYYTLEQCIFDSEGRLRSNRTWNYKVPGMMDIPVNYRIKFPQKNPNPVGILKSKAVGEPPACLSVSVPLAIRRAMASAREEADPTQPKWVPFDEITSADFTFRHSLNHYKDYVI